MQATFAMVRRLPPPATGAHILTWLNSTGAGLAANAWIALIVKFVVRYVVLADVVPNLLFSP